MRAPDGWVGGTIVAVDRLRLPVVVVIVLHQAEGLAAVSAPGIGLFNGQLRTVQHAFAEDRLRIGRDGAKETDADFGEVRWLGNVAARAHVQVGVRIVHVVRRREFCVRAQVGGLAGVGSHYSILGRPGRIGSAFAFVLRRSNYCRSPRMQSATARLLVRI